jgi:hypothetical protein
MPRLGRMARIGYAGEGSNFRRLLNHSPQVSTAYWELRKALNEGVLSPRLRILSFLSSDLVNRCSY